MLPLAPLGHTSQHTARHDMAGRSQRRGAKGGNADWAVCVCPSCVSVFNFFLLTCSLSVNPCRLPTYPNFVSFICSLNWVEWLSVWTDGSQRSAANAASFHLLQPVKTSVLSAAFSTSVNPKKKIYACEWLRQRGSELGWITIAFWEKQNVEVNECSRENPSVNGICHNYLVESTQKTRY